MEFYSDQNYQKVRFETPVLCTSKSPMSNCPPPPRHRREMDITTTPDDQQDPITVDLQTLSLSSPDDDPLNNPYGSLNDLCYELSSLQNLAACGSWRSILDKVVCARTQSLITKPHEPLIYLSYNALALTKLRRFANAVAEIDSLENDLDSSNYSYQNYPQYYPNRSGSMVPFVLRWLHAELSAKLGKRSKTLDHFYLLMDFIRDKLSDKLSNMSTTSAELWRKREGFVINSIISHHLSLKEFEVCLDLIRDLISRNDGSNSDSRAVLLSKLAYIQMQFGDLEGEVGRAKSVGLDGEKMKLKKGRKKKKGV